MGFVLLCFALATPIAASNLAYVYQFHGPLPALLGTLAYTVAAFGAVVWSMHWRKRDGCQ